MRVPREQCGLGERHDTVMTSYDHRAGGGHAGRGGVVGTNVIVAVCREGNQKGRWGGFPGMRGSKYLEIVESCQVLLLLSLSWWGRARRRRSIRLCCSTTVMFVRDGWIHLKRTASDAQVCIFCRMTGVSSWAFEYACTLRPLSEACLSTATIVEVWFAHHYWGERFRIDGTHGNESSHLNSCLRERRCN